MAEIPERVEVLIVGAGLAGLTAAAILARGGKKVWVLDANKEIGGRARSLIKRDIAFNLGPHALYVDGAARRILVELGIEFGGGMPSGKGQVLYDRKLHALPGDPVSLMTTGFLGFKGKMDAGRIMTAIPKLDPEDYRDVTVTDWANRSSTDKQVRKLLLALARLTTYANAPEIMSAEVFLRQLQMALSGNVLYLDRGWQSIVDGLTKAAIKEEATILAGQRVERIEAGFPNRVRMHDGSNFEADAVVLATGPTKAGQICNGPEASRIRTFSERATAAVTSCFTVALRKKLGPVDFLLGIDQPVYYSNHSAVAQLAPGDTQVIHLAVYHPSLKNDPRGNPQDELEVVLDRMQPGWRDEVLEQQFLPAMTAATAIPYAERGGISERPDVAISAAHKLFVAGDWVGQEGFLADASMASAKAAATELLES